MNAQRFTVATVVGGIAMFVLGFVIWVVLFAGFFEANSTTGWMKDPPAFWAVGIGQLGFAALLTLVIGKWAGTVGAGPGMKTGALVGLVAAIGVDFTMYGTADLTNLTATLVDIPLVAIQTGIAGAVIGWVLARGAVAEA